MVMVLKAWDHKQSRYVITVEWAERVDNTNLRCELMNLAGSQFIYISPSSFSFHIRSDFDALKLQKEANKVYQKYCVFGS